jgi:hypothetical protein
MDKFEDSCNSTRGDSTTSSPNGQGNGSVSAGTLTAGAGDDNRNFDFFLE